MRRKVLFFTLILIIFFHINALATTVVGVIGENDIYLVSDTRLTITKANGERLFNDNGKKLFKLKNGVGLAFVGDTNTIKRLKSGKAIITKSVETIVNDLQLMSELNNLSLSEITEILCEKYVSLLVDYSGDILVAGYENGNAIIYGIKVSKGKINCHGISGNGSFYVLGSGCNIFTSKLKENLDDKNIDLKDVALKYLSKFNDNELKVLMEKCLQDVINEYSDNYNFKDQTTGGNVDTLILSK